MEPRRAPHRYVGKGAEIMSTEDRRVIIIQQRQIARLTALAESLISAMDRQTDAIGRLVAIAMTPQEDEDIDPGKPAKPMYLSNED